VDSSTTPADDSAGTGPNSSEATTVGTQNSTAISSTSSTSARVPVAENNGRQWFDGNTEVEVNGKPSTKFWKLVDQYGTGTEYTPGCDRATKKFRAIDYFMAVFLKDQLFQMQERTSEVLVDNNLQLTSTGEVLKLMGILVLITRFKFGSQASLWSTTARNRFIPPPNLGHTTGMSRERFDHLWRFMVWSKQPYPRPNDMSHEQWRWALVQDFVDNFNEHRKTFYQ
jgi:Transposase IS4